MLWAGSRSHPPPGTGMFNCSMRINQQGRVCLATRVKSIQYWYQGPCPHFQLVGVFLGAQSQTFGLSKATGNWKGNLIHRNVRADGLGQKNITTTCAPAGCVFVFLFCRADQGSQAGWAQMGSRYVPCESQSCQPWGHPHVPRAPQVCQHIPS